MEMNFCRRCREELAHLQAHVYECSNGHTIFANSSPSIGLFLVGDDGRVLMTIRGIEPHKGMLDTAGGFVDGEETLEQAITREIREELGLTPDQYSPPKFLCSVIGHYPYKNEEIPVLSSFFWAKLKPNAEPTTNDDVGEVVWVDIDTVNIDEAHDKDVKQGILALRKELHGI